MTRPDAGGVGVAWAAEPPIPGRLAGWEAPAQSLVRCSRQIIEAHFVARPTDLSGPFIAQADSMYRNLLEEMKTRGVRPDDIVTEKVFLGEMRAQARPLLEAREAALKPHRGNGSPVPALSLVEQPPAGAGRRCEVQAVAVLPASGFPLVSREVRGLPAGSTGRIIEAEGAQHLFVSGITAPAAVGPLPFAREADWMFRGGDRAVAAAGFSFREVVRTWIYLTTIDADYADLNASRRAFFKSRDVRPAPASTGIRGGVFPPDRACALDLRAVRGPGVAAVRPIHALTMNEAPDYGADFSRGASVTFQHRRVLYLSGTASIDTSGEVVAVGDIRGQVERMLVNVKALLDAQGAAWSDLVSAVTYLKRPEYAETFREVCAERGVPEQVPNTLCVADICRPEWLCEMEAIAVMT